MGWESLARDTEVAQIRIYPPEGKMGRGRVSQSKHEASGPGSGTEGGGLFPGSAVSKSNKFEEARRRSWVI